MHSAAILIDKLSERLLTQTDNQSVTTERGEDGLQKLKASRQQLTTGYNQGVRNSINSHFIRCPVQITDT